MHRSRFTSAALIALVTVASVAVPAVAAVRPAARIVFSRLEPSGYRLYSMRADGREVVQLTSGPGDDIQPHVSRDGRIVFARGWGTFPRGPYTQIYIRERNGDVRPLFSSASPTADYFPRWSPDGRRIAFTRASPGGELSPLSGDAAVIVANADGSRLRVLTPRAGFGFPTWAPDGRRIAFNGPPGGAPGLFTMDIFAARPIPRRITTSAYQPAWSPDGRLIAFTSMRDGGSWQVYVIRPDGRNPRRLTVTPGHQDKNPAWSADGRTIAFESTRDNPCPEDASAACRPSRIYVMTSDGRRQRMITGGPADSYPAWSLTR